MARLRGSSLGRDRSDPVGEEDPVRLRPFLLPGVHRAHAHEALRARVEDLELPVLVGDHHPVADAVEDRRQGVRLAPQLLGVPPELGLHLLQPGDVAEHHHSAARGAVLVQQRPAADVEEHPLGRLRIAGEHLHVVRRLALERPHQGKIVRRKGGLPVRKEDAVAGDPLGGAGVIQFPGDVGAGRRVDEHVVPFPVGDQHPVGDRVEDGRPEAGLLPELRRRPPEVGLRLPGRGDVPPHDEAAKPRPVGSDERPRNGRDPPGVAGAPVPDHDFEVVHRLAADRAREGLLLPFVGGVAARRKYLVTGVPVGGVPDPVGIRGESARGRVHDEEPLLVRVGGERRQAHGVEHGLQDRGPPLDAGGRGAVSLLQRSFARAGGAGVRNPAPEPPRGSRASPRGHRRTRRIPAASAVRRPARPGGGRGRRSPRPLPLRRAAPRANRPAGPGRAAPPRPPRPPREARRRRRRPSGRVVRRDRRGHRTRRPPRRSGSAPRRPAGRGVPGRRPSPAGMRSWRGAVPFGQRGSPGHP